LYSATTSPEAGPIEAAPIIADPKPAWPLDATRAADAGRITAGATLDVPVFERSGEVTPALFGAAVTNAGTIATLVVSIGEVTAEVVKGTVATLVDSIGEVTTALVTAEGAGPVDVVVQVWWNG